MSWGASGRFCAIEWSVSTPVLTAGLDVGGTKILALTVGRDGSVFGDHRELTPQRGPELVAALVAAANTLRAKSPAIAAVGVGAPGLVDRDGVLRFAPNLPDVEPLALRAELTDILDLPVYVDNDATCAAWAERECGAGEHSSHMLVATL